MTVALNEAKLAKGVEESQEPLASMVTKYHNNSNLYDNKSTTKTIEDSYTSSWCSSFVSWCLDETEYKGLKQTGSRFYIAHDDEWNKKSKNMFVKVYKPLYGALMVFSDCTKEGVLSSSGHIAFVYGTVKGSNKIAALGGNQSNQLKVTPFDCSGKVFVSWTRKNKAGKVIKIHYKKFRGFYMPKDFKGGVLLGEQNSYKNFKEANLEATTVAIKTNKNGESS
ncbi:CHAP domain-containing protein [Olleya sp. Bg11-27]|nr:CHAP domain-containing protein [Olleya sp. Bg11-27]AUC76027.1 hypothetical protein CW732_10285 [Olleya sp. Bg11-27]